MAYKFFLTSLVSKKLGKLDRNTSERILKKLKFFADSDNPLQYANKLVDHDPAQFYFRVGDWRIIFVLVKGEGGVVFLEIIGIGNRKDIYKKL